MSIRTTVTFDDDVLERVRQESRSRGASFRDTLNDLLRTGLILRASQATKEKFRVIPFETGFARDLNYDCTEALIEYLEGPEHR